MEKNPLPPMNARTREGILSSNKNELAQIIELTKSELKRMENSDERVFVEMAEDFGISVERYKECLEERMGGLGELIQQRYKELNA